MSKIGSFASTILIVRGGPSDLQQRNGRGKRQGNLNPVIRIRQYVTRGTFDSYLWQIQEQKLRFITQVMTGKVITRTCEDIDETVLTAAEFKAIATNNPLLAEKMNVVMRLRAFPFYRQAGKTNEPPYSVP